MLIDEVTIRVFSGKGGDGRAAFNKTKMNLGPTGGNGGAGGSVYLEGTADIGALSRFRGVKVFRAESGQPGGTKNDEGSDGDDLILKVPTGTVVHFLSPLKEEAEITKIGQRLLVAEGGRGGRGNFLFRSAQNTSPKEFEKGTEGQEVETCLELKLIADVGFIGFPNVGKSSLLNELTNAKSKVANYSFTTLEPNLGVFYELILADIPGLIEGAAGGKGLGVKFLRHIERTSVFFHFVSAETADPVSDYKAVRKELELYNSKLLEKKEYIFLSKSDMIEPKELEKKIKELKKINSQIFALSVLDEESLETVRKILREIIKEKKAK
jgi:GTP-binding protein